MKMSKFTNFLKEVWGWFVAILVVVSGWFLIDKFFLNKSDKEEELLSDIEQTQSKIDDLEVKVKDKLEKEKELEKEQVKVKEKIDQTYNNYEERVKAAEAKKKKIKEESKDHQGNLDYMNKKYGKKND